MLNLFRNAGVRVASDDFGHGSSSFTRLARMPLDVLRIDRSCLDQTVLEKRKASAVLQSIAHLSKNPSIFTIVEGVETEHQLYVVREADTDLTQGFYFSRPNPMSDVESFLNKHAVAHRNELHQVS